MLGITGIDYSTFNHIQNESQAVINFTKIEIVLIVDLVNKQLFISGEPERVFTSFRTDKKLSIENSTT